MKWIERERMERCGCSVSVIGLTGVTVVALRLGGRAHTPTSDSRDTG